MVLLPVIFKLIGKRLERASEGTPEVVNDDDAPIEDWAETYVLPVPEEAPASVQKPVQETVKVRERKPVESKPILQEEVKKKREKIDTKKMIVYSEIMKPKYTE